MTSISKLVRSSTWERFAHRHILLVSLLWLFSVSNTIAQQQFPVSRPVALRDLVPRGDVLAVQDLSFDASFAAQALEYFRSKDPALVPQMAASPAIAHIQRHARNFDYDVPKDSAQALVTTLLGSPDQQASRSATCQQSLAYFTWPMMSDPHWVADALRYMPADFQFHGTLFLTYGYDIGVAFGATASLNCTHAHFKERPRELLYYAIHELHHTAFMSYHEPPRLSDVKTCDELLRMVEYLTQMEGMAVLAVYERRRDEHTLNDDPDYVALQDSARMEADVAAYFKELEYLKSRGSSLADDEAWKIIGRMSSGERLWYRVGALMAQRIEKAKGRATLVDSVKRGPAEFFAIYKSLAISQPISQHCVSQDVDRYVSRTSNGVLSHALGVLIDEALRRIPLPACFSLPHGRCRKSFHACSVGVHLRSG